MCEFLYLVVIITERSDLVFGLNCFVVTMFDLKSIQTVQFDLVFGSMLFLVHLCDIIRLIFFFLILITCDSCLFYLI